MKVLALALLAAACGSQSSGPARESSGSAASPFAGQCEGLRARAEQLYRAEAEAKEPKRVDEATADNVRMVMVDCAKMPELVVPCLRTASSVAQIEKDCLIPLQPDGTETQKGEFL